MAWRSGWKSEESRTSSDGGLYAFAGIISLAARKQIEEQSSGVRLLTWDRRRAKSWPGRGAGSV